MRVGAGVASRRRAHVGARRPGAMGEYWEVTQELLQGASPLVRKPKVRRARSPSRRRGTRASLSPLSLALDGGRISRVRDRLTFAPPARPPSAASSPRRRPSHRPLPTPRPLRALRPSPRAAHGGAPEEAAVPVPARRRLRGRGARRQGDQRQGREGGVPDQDLQLRRDIVRGNAPDAAVKGGGRVGAGADERVFAGARARRRARRRRGRGGAMSTRRSRPRGRRAPRREEEGGTSTVTGGEGAVAVAAAAADGEGAVAVAVAA
eukprot:31149-Pelagococcus_subviridis.AAC.5